MPNELKGMRIFHSGNIKIKNKRKDHKRPLIWIENLAEKMGNHHHHSHLQKVEVELLSHDMEYLKSKLNWKKSEIQSLCNWFHLHKEGQNFTWTDWRAVVNRKRNIPLGFLARLWSFIYSVAERERIGMSVDLIAPVKLKTIKIQPKVSKAEETPLEMQNHIDRIDQMGVENLMDTLSTSMVVNGFALTGDSKDKGFDRLLVQKELEHKKVRNVVSTWIGDSSQVEEEDHVEKKILKQYKEYSERFDKLFSGESITFKEFAIALHKLTNSKLEQRITTSFSLFQKDDEVLASFVLNLGKQLKEYSGIHLNTVVEAVDTFFSDENLNFEEYKKRCNSDPQRYRLILSCWGVLDRLEKEIEKAKEFAHETKKSGTLYFEGYKYEAVADSGALVLTSKKGRTAFQIELVSCDVLKDDHNKKSFILAFIDKKLHFVARSERNCISWMNVIIRNTIKLEEPLKTRFKSFAPIRQKINAKWYVDGKNYFKDALAAINLAKEEIFITDWSFSPEIYLGRDDPDPFQRLDLALIRAGNRGVKICILVWREAAIISEILNSKHTSLLFKGKKNINVIRHKGAGAVFFWSHHQKSLIVDRKLAFVGGIDLTYGRYDDEQHRLFDHSHLRPTWVGKDYYNPAIEFCDRLDFPFEMKLNRDIHPREPWHDIQCGGDGEFANDVARNFIERWNHHVRESGKKVPLLVPLLSTEQQQEKFPFPFFAKHEGGLSLQLCRSMSLWSGTNRTEASIYEAYKYYINEAEHFIYIENQFFISGVSGVENKIVDFLAEKIISKIQNKEIFRLVIILPMHSEGKWLEDDVVKIIYGWQQKTIKRLYERVGEHTETPEDYISLNYLLKNEYNPILDRYFIHPIYLHSKLMIVDDRVVICGSANINDRSMMGDRDSELAAIIEGKHDVMSHMAGKSFRVTTFAHTLRISLWREHLGLKPSQIGHIRDPASDEVYHRIWLKRAIKNKILYSPIFENRLNPKTVTLKLKEGFDALVDVSSFLKVENDEEMDTEEHDEESVDLPTDDSFVIEEQHIKSHKNILERSIKIDPFEGWISPNSTYMFGSQGVNKVDSKTQLFEDPLQKEQGEEQQASKKEEDEEQLLEILPNSHEEELNSKEELEEGEYPEGVVYTRKINSEYLGETEIKEIVLPPKISFRKRIKSVVHQVGDAMHQMGEKIEEKVNKMKEGLFGDQKQLNVAARLKMVKGHLVPFPKNFVIHFRFSSWKSNLPTSIFV